MKLICEGPAEHLKLTSHPKSNCTLGTSSGGNAGHHHDPHHNYQYHQLTKGTDTEDTEDELKAPLLSINQRLNEIYVSSGGERRRPLSSSTTSNHSTPNWVASRETTELHQLTTPTTPSAVVGYAPRHKFCPFPSRRDINHRLSIWDGDIKLLQVEALSTGANAEQTLTLTGKHPHQYQQSQHQCITSNNNNGGGSHCDSGEVVPVTPLGFPSVSSAKYILHNVCPVFREKCRTQTAALFSCYRNVLTKAVDLGVKSVAVCTVSSQEKDTNNHNNNNHFPTDTGAHIALRTVRRFLEASPEFRVVLCVDKAERALYNALTPLYFPASKAEEEAATYHLPTDIGGPLGEPSDPERQIRIIQNPRHDAMNGADDDSDSSPHDLEGGNVDLEYGTVLLNLQNHQSFTQMQGDLDRQRLLGDRPRAGVYESVIEDGLEGIEHQERYEKLLKRAQTEDLREVSGIGCLYQSGVDRLGRPVIVFCGKWFPAQDINLEKALLYLIYLLDPIVNGDYVITYFHTLTSSANYPSLHWLKDVYTVLPYKYKKHLKAFYIVHPTIWTKMVTWWFTTFMAPAIKAKVHSLPGVEHLYSAISKDQLEIPAYITEYDMTVNGLHYYQPMGPNTTS